MSTQLSSPTATAPPRPPMAECDISPEPLGMDCVMSHRLSVSFLKSKHCQFTSTIAPLALAEARACCMATVGLPPEAPWEKVRVCSWKRIFLSLPLWLLFISLAAPSLPFITPSLPLLMPFSPSQPPDAYYWVCREWHKPCLSHAALLWPWGEPDSGWSAHRGWQSREVGRSQVCGGIFELRVLPSLDLPSIWTCLVCDDKLPYYSDQSEPVSLVFLLKHRSYHCIPNVECSPSPSEYSAASSAQLGAETLPTPKLTVFPKLTSPATRSHSKLLKLPCLWGRYFLLQCALSIVNPIHTLPSGFKASLSTSSWSTGCRIVEGLREQTGLGEWRGHCQEKGGYDETEERQKLNLIRALEALDPALHEGNIPSDFKKFLWVFTFPILFRLCFATKSIPYTFPKFKFLIMLCLTAFKVKGQKWFGFLFPVLEDTHC